MAIRLRCLLLLRLWLDIVFRVGYPVGVAGCPTPGLSARLLFLGKGTFYVD